MYPQQGFPRWGACPLLYEIFFELPPPIKADRNEVLYLKMKPAPTEKWPLPHPLKNEDLFQDMIPRKNQAVANWHLVSAFHLLNNIGK